MHAEEATNSPLAQPPRFASRVLLWAIITLFCSGTAWATLSQVDIVAIARGSIVPEGKVVAIQTPIAGRVARTLVQDGDTVSVGDPLVQLDTTDLDSAHAAVLNELQDESLSRWRAGALLRFLGQTSADYDVGAPRGTTATDHALLSAERDAMAQRIKTEKTALSAAEAAMRLAEEDHDLQQRLHKLSAQRAKAQQTLWQKRLISEAQWHTAETERLAAEARLARTSGAVQRAENALANSRLQLESTKAKMTSTLHTQFSNAESNRKRLQLKMERLAAQRERTTLRATVDGTVEHLQIQPTGNVLRAADLVMHIVPRDAHLIVEAQVSDRDIAFVEVGQAVSLKVDAYPFARHGSLAGTLTQVSQDAASDGAGERNYLARIRLDSNADPGSQFNLRPGMSVTAELRTGKRRVIDFLISPILRYRGDSLKER